MEALVARYRQGGQGVPAFAREHGVTAATVYRWLAVVKAEGGGNVVARPVAGFARVVMKSPAPALPGAGVVTLRTAQGWALEVSGMEARYVGALIREVLPCLR